MTFWFSATTFRSITQIVEPQSPRADPESFDERDAWSNVANIGWAPLRQYIIGVVINMKTIQITMDEALLAKLDADDEVRRDGRSAVLRRAAREYLRKRRTRAIAGRYAEAYGSVHGLGVEFSGWEDEGAWPER